jgi:peptidoglycan/xylan/chitin deacetylase (PgdA/CDA1 family)
VLPRPWRWIYRHDRNQGLAVLERFLVFLKEHGFTFSTLGAVARDLTEAAAC